MLRDAGIEVVTGVLEKEAAELNAGFFLRINAKRPLVTIKLARSADNKTARLGADKWITGEEARRFGHLLRAQNDAILIGIGTALSDDPMLDCRLPGLEDRSPLRVVLDTHLRLPESAKLVQTARQIPTLVFTASEGGEALRKHGVEIVNVARDAQGRVDRLAVLHDLAARGITRQLIEGGATVASAFRDMSDRLEIFTAPLTLGQEGRGAWDVPPDFMRVSERVLGRDMLVSYARNS
jgi:diaminohydroxyphosphoribosylaminopyrimidine deaminase/5-amino-6-(5-phosphoribosylamino)uracil reductase